MVLLVAVRENDIELITRKLRCTHPLLVYAKVNETRTHMLNCKSPNPSVRYLARDYVTFSVLVLWQK